MTHLKHAALSGAAIALLYGLAAYAQVVIQPAKGGGSGGVSVNPYSNIAAGMVYSSNPLPCLSGPVAYTQWSGIALPNGQGTRLFTAAAGWIYVLSRVELGTAFTSSSGTVTNLAIALGSTAKPVGFMDNFPILPTPTVAYNEAAGGIGLAAGASTLDVFAQLSVTNNTPGNLNTLTAGTVTITICGMKP